MNKFPNFPAPALIKKNIDNLHSACIRLDALTMQLDELIALVEADIRNSPINVHRKEKAKQLGGKDGGIMND